MKVTVYLPGKQPEKHYMDAIREYQKRLLPFCTARLVFQKGNSPANIPEREHVFAVSPGEKNISSEELADRINQLGLAGKSRISFSLMEDCPERQDGFSLTPMEMDPGLQAVVLFEQIYRGFQIIHGRPYHK
ncbi:MAG: 23S rRNA (pseudouridine(1915)-N(3))-methyltransferase RlmH [Clostridia bacterium]